MATTYLAAKLHHKLVAMQCNQGGWGFNVNQPAVEPTCLAILALRHSRTAALELGLQVLKNLQNSDGSWPAFVDDKPEGCWTTSLAVLTLMAIQRQNDRANLGIRWLLGAKGREANWFWRWKFQVVDKSVQFNPAKYGWSWVSGTTSWIIPTAFSLITLRQVGRRGFAPACCIAERISTGITMLLDRMCPGGGWNAGNGVAFGVPYAPYIDATSIVLLALAGSEKEPSVQESLSWLVGRLPKCPSPYSLAWGILALAMYRTRHGVNDMLDRATNDLAALIQNSSVADDICTLAACALAFEAAEGDNVFGVR
jgi:hypothetical protein